jgi:two-component system phosphate regulon sensor histidine kinase PhoR
VAARLIKFLALLSAASLAGSTWLPMADIWQSMLAGAALFLFVWALADLWRGQRFLTWLIQQDVDPLPMHFGHWGEIADRIKRLRRKHNEALSKIEDNLSELIAAIQASPNGVLLLDATDHIEWCNLTAAQHLGLDAQRDKQQLIGNLVRDPKFLALLQSPSGAEGVVIEGRSQLPKAIQKISLHWFTYGEGRRLLLSRDVTALEQADTMRRDFVANVSHEIRTPLTVLSGFIETLQTLQLTDTEKEKFLSLMSQQAQRMQSLVSDLLMLSRLEGSPLPNLQEITSVSALWQVISADARALTRESQAEELPSHKMQFHLDAALLHAHVAGSRTELQSAMSNLISNAIRYTPAGGCIDIGWQDLGAKGVEFWVKDDGPGIESEHLSRLTERFYRVDRSRSRETGGTGLGLAIVKHVVQRHGGQLHISSQFGNGSRFSFTLPRDRFDVIADSTS